MKLNNTLQVCVLSLTLPLVVPIWAEDELKPPTPTATPAAPVPVAKSRSSRNRSTSANANVAVDELEIGGQGRAFAGQLGVAEARIAADRAKIAALDIRRGLRRGDPNHTLVLPTETGRPESLAEAHEDLAVMSRILNKTVEKESRRAGRGTFVFTYGETGSNLDAMYLEGYGALFMLNTDFPLAAPPPPPSAKPLAKDEDPTWERNKREVRGREDLDDENVRYGNVGGWVSEDDQPKYDGERVESLKRRLTEALKHAKNLRGLKDGEHVTLVVSGNSVGKRTHVSRVLKLADTTPANEDEAPIGKPLPPNVVGYLNTDSARQSTLLIRAKKSDIQRFAAGEMKSEEFARAVSVSAF